MQDNQKEVERIKHDIIKYQFTQFCKRNTQAIALILKALLQASKHFPSDQELQEVANKPTLESSI